MKAQTAMKHRLYIYWIIFWKTVLLEGYDHYFLAFLRVEFSPLDDANWANSEDLPPKQLYRRQT